MKPSEIKNVIKKDGSCRILMNEYEEIRAEVKADIAKECHYLLASGMGKNKSLEHLIRMLGQKGEETT